MTLRGVTKRAGALRRQEEVREDNAKKGIRKWGGIMHLESS